MRRDSRRLPLGHEIQYLHTHVPARGRIETPEDELAFLDDDHRIHLVPSYFLYFLVESTPDRPGGL